ncbi:uncharacterized protein LOC132166751 isoform X2 [Corylus avellana]|uniref:uncharacterized protein LOC132166751 isoform X2 n=1 Tax=Corylus avellana TaxID=13451 RepID=UPI00286AE35B|nr:uncharacterized protein LOC132166751 isoform X2 [Corylus avellana]
MPRGLTRTTTSIFISTSVPRTTPPLCKRPFVSHRHFPRPRSVTWTRFLCKCSRNDEDPVDMSKYKEAFSRRMAMAGLKPHHRIALGVSGGPDSMALCVLTASWKTNGLNAAGESSGFIDGILAIIVDHGLRAESKDEANIVSNRVSQMGIRCEIAHCDWLDGRPKQGHLQEAARDMRYQTFQKVCDRHHIGVLLIAHHADDQAELFILRLSRNSGVLGLAGMPFTSQIFSTHSHSFGGVSNNHGILLVRPLLDFSKEDMYKICLWGNQEWVEDPSNQILLFARNRIRMSLRDSSSCMFKSELQAVISACRRTRSYVDQVCSKLINQAVVVINGYAVIDLQILNPSKVEDICLSRFLALVLQFISQRYRPVRGSASKLLLDYIRTFPCKTSLTAAGCYLCPVPGSKGTKTLVCCSVDCPLPSKTQPFHACTYGEQEHCVPCELEQVLVDGKLYSDQLVLDESNVRFLNVTSESVLTEAKRLGMLSESTYRNILLLQREETKRFKSKIELSSDSNSKHGFKSGNTLQSEPLQLGDACYFMSRYLVKWKLNEGIDGSAFSEKANYDLDLGGESWQCHCRSCVAELRHMVESDWLYLAKLSKCASTLDKFQQQGVLSTDREEQIPEKISRCLEYARLSAQRALFSLKSIPVAARGGLPVLVNPQGLLLSIPSIGFNSCPCLVVSAEFKPRVPLGGGQSSFI